MGSPVLAEAIARQQERLGAQGRILVRPSGTEPLIRIMVEAKDKSLLQSVVGELVSVIRSLA